jgi:AraC-like DNA-binding protein
MRQHLDQPLQISTLTTLAKVSPSYLFALFKRMTGHPPIDYFIHLRMQRACEFLEGTSLCVKEVAAALGYDDQFYFSRVFKSVQGVAPREFRLRLADPARMNGTEPLTGPEKATSEVSLLPLPAGQPASPNGWRVEDSP